MNAQEKARFIAKVLDDKKAEEVQILHVEEHTALTSYFVLAHGNNKPQVKALADEVEDKLAEIGFVECKKESDPEASWIALDFEDVIIHIFQKDTRAFFNLEHLWAQAERVDIETSTQKEGE